LSLKKIQGYNVIVEEFPLQVLVGATFMTPVIAGSINRTPTGPHRGCDMFNRRYGLHEDQQLPYQIRGFLSPSRKGLVQFRLGECHYDRLSEPTDKWLDRLRVAQPSYQETDRRKNSRMPRTLRPIKSNIARKSQTPCSSRQQRPPAGSWGDRPRRRRARRFRRNGIRRSFQNA